MNIDYHKDIERGIEIIKFLHQAYTEKSFFDFTQLPEDVLPVGMDKGSNDHLLYLTLVSSVAYLRKEERLWPAARETWEDEEKRYLFYPDKILSSDPVTVDKDLKDYNVFINPLVLKHWSVGKLKSVDRRSLRENDLQIWINMANALSEHQSDVEQFFKDYDYDAVKIVNLFSTGKYKGAFPEYHKHRKAIVWLAKICRNATFRPNNLDKITMVTGSHIIRATFLSGAIWGQLNSIAVDLDKLVGDFWNEVYSAGKDELEVSPVEFQTYLWILSRHGCRVGRDGEICSQKSDCPVGEFCIAGRFQILDRYITIDTHQKDS